MSMLGPRQALAKKIPFFYGWIMIPVVMISFVCTSPGQTFGVSAFHPFILADLNLSRSQLGDAYALGTILAAIPMTYVGTLMDRYGPRLVMMYVVGLLGMGCFFISRAQDFLTLFIGFFLLRVLAQGSLGLLAGNTLPLWFDRRLGRVSGLSSVAVSAAIAVVPALNLFLAKTYGWRQAYIFWGLGVCVVMFPILALVYHNRPEDLGQERDGVRIRVEDRKEKPEKSEEAERAFTLGQAVRTAPYWIMGTAIALWAMIATGVVFSLMDLALDKGIDVEKAALTFTTFGIFSSIFQLGGGFLADFYPLPRILVTSMLGFAAGLVILIYADSPADLLTFGVVFGAAQGLLVAVGATLWVRYYGRKNLGKIRGSMTTVMVGSSSLGPLLMGHVRDFTGSYNGILWLFAGLVCPMVLVALAARRPHNPART